MPALNTAGERLGSALLQEREGGRADPAAGPMLDVGTYLCDRRWQDDRIVRTDVVSAFVSEAGTGEAPLAGQLRSRRPVLSDQWWHRDRAPAPTYP